MEINIEKENELKRLQEIIENNLSLIQILFNDKINEDTLDIDDNFEKDFDKLVIDFFKENQNNNLNELYIYYLSLNEDKDLESLFIKEIDENIDEEIIEDLIAYQYFTRHNNTKDFIKFLKERHKTKEIYRWLETETKNTAFKYLLKHTTRFLKENNYEFLEIDNNATSIMLEDIYNNWTVYDLNEYELKEFNKENLEELFFEFLNFINAPQNWYEQYTILKNNDRKIFEEKNKEDEDESSCCYIDKDDQPIIIIYDDNTISTFTDFVHEFVHSLSMNKNTSYKPTSELPSIFFEILSAIFLYTKGYPKETINEKLSFRKYDSLDSIMQLYYNNSKLKNMLHKYNINPKLKNYWQKHINLNEETANTIYKINEENKGFVQIVTEKGKEKETKDFFINEFLNNCYADKKKYNNTTEALLEYGFFIVDVYQYLIGFYITNILLNRLYKDDTIIPNMIDIANNLNELTLEDILKILNIEMNNNKTKTLKKEIN